MVRRFVDELPRYRRGRLFWEDGKPFMLQQLQLTMDADKLRTGQIAVIGSYCITMKPSNEQYLMHPYINGADLSY